MMRPTTSMARFWEAHWSTAPTTQIQPERMIVYLRPKTSARLDTASEPTRLPAGIAATIAPWGPAVGELNWARYDGLESTPDMDEMSSPKRPPPMQANEPTTYCRALSAWACAARRATHRVRCECGVVLRERQRGAGVRRGCDVHLYPWWKSQRHCWHGHSTRIYKGGVSQAQHRIRSILHRRIVAAPVRLAGHEAGVRAEPFTLHRLLYIKSLSGPTSAARVSSARPLPGPRFCTTPPHWCRYGGSVLVWHWTAGAQAHQQRLPHYDQTSRRSCRSCQR